MQHYQPYEVRQADRLIYTFTSRGKRDIIKVVDYSPIYQFLDNPVYNLAFGDMIGSDNYVYSDWENSNNGDMYKIFQTVLSTIPMFFAQYPSAMLYVSGVDMIRKQLYRRYVNQQYDQLAESYGFYGCYIFDKKIEGIEKYVVGKRYDAIITYVKE